MRHIKSADPCHHAIGVRTVRKVCKVDSYRNPFMGFYPSFNLSIDKVLSWQVIICLNPSHPPSGFIACVIDRDLSHLTIENVWHRRGSLLGCYACHYIEKANK
jgi:hypothetical protein